MSHLSLPLHLVPASRGSERAISVRRCPPYFFLVPLSSRMIPWLRFSPRGTTWTETPTATPCGSTRDPVSEWVWELSGPGESILSRKGCPGPPPPPLSTPIGSSRFEKERRRGLVGGVASSALWARVFKGAG